MNLTFAGNSESIVPLPDANDLSNAIFVNFLPIIFKETIEGTPDDDDIRGTRPSSNILGKGGNDTLRGRSRIDSLSGQNGEDILVGNSGDDRLQGGNGNDTLIGSAGRDILFGERGDDTLQGSTGNDVLFGRQGNDTLLGGNGKDAFALDRLGVDRILDFKNGEDKLGFTAIGFGATSLQVLRRGDNTLIKSDGDRLAILVDVNASSIKTNDFAPIWFGK